MESGKEPQDTAKRFRAQLVFRALLFIELPFAWSSVILFHGKKLLGKIEKQ